MYQKIKRQSGVSYYSKHKFLPLIVGVGAGIGGIIYHSTAIGVACALGCYLLWRLYRLYIK